MTLITAKITLVILWLAQNNLNYGSRQIDEDRLAERTIECRPRTGKQRKTNSEQDQQIIAAGIHFKNDCVTEIMGEIRHEVEFDISKSTFNRRLLGNVFY
jgi:hypothetical protein